MNSNESRFARFVAHEQSSVDWPIEPTRSALIVEGGITEANIRTSFAWWRAILESLDEFMRKREEKAK